jgi:iron complex outermembrane receptor protein
MGPNTFWNLNLGQRDKVDVYAEQEQRWSPPGATRSACA